MTGPTDNEERINELYVEIDTLKDVIIAQAKEIYELRTLLKGNPRP